MGNTDFFINFVAFQSQTFQRHHNMKRICLTTRDDLHIIPIDKIAYIEASGNYSNIAYIEGHKTMLTLGLSKVEEVIAASYQQGTPSPFIRMGRSLIINQNYLCSLNVLKQQIILSDFAQNRYVITAPKQLIKDYKEIVRTEYRKRLCQKK